MTNRTVVTADQYILLTYSTASAPHEQDGTINITWMYQGTFSDQTEVVKWMMTSDITFHDYKIVKVNLPLLLRPDHATVGISELTEDGLAVELEDEHPTDEYSAPTNPEGL